MYVSANIFFGTICRARYFTVRALTSQTALSVQDVCTRGSYKGRRLNKGRRPSNLYPQLTTTPTEPVQLAIALAHSSTLPLKGLNS